MRVCMCVCVFPFFLSMGAIICIVRFFTVSRAKILGNAELFIKSGSDINLTCLAMQSPVPPSFIYWYKGKRVMNYSQRGGINVITERSTRTSKLLIAKATSADSGNYTCSPSSSGELSPPSCGCGCHFPAPLPTLSLPLFLSLSPSPSLSSISTSSSSSSLAPTSLSACLRVCVSVASLVLCPLAINVTALANGISSTTTSCHLATLAPQRCTRVSFLWQVTSIKMGTCKGRAMLRLTHF